MSTFLTIPLDRLGNFSPATTPKCFANRFTEVGVGVKWLGVRRLGKMAARSDAARQTPPGRPGLQHTLIRPPSDAIPPRYCRFSALPPYADFFEYNQCIICTVCPFTNHGFYYKRHPFRQRQRGPWRGHGRPPTPKPGAAATAWYRGYLVYPPRVDRGLPGGGVELWSGRKILLRAVIVCQGCEGY
jgi:hypothetical protein